MIAALIGKKDAKDLIALPEHIEEFLDYGRSRCIAFNPAGTLLASGCEEGEVVVWDCFTRGVARVYRGHRSPVVFVGWGGSGRHLVSASQDGRLVQWDVLSGEQLAALDCCPPGGAVVGACLDPAHEAQLLVSFLQGPVQFVDLRNGQRTPLPMYVLETKKSAARVVVQQGGQQQQHGEQQQPGAGGGGGDGSEGVAQLAVLSKCGRYVFATTKGTLALHRRSDLALLDLVMMQHNQVVTMLQHGQGGMGSWLLVISQDRAIRAYQVDRALEAARPHAASELQAVTKTPKANTSMLRPEGALLTFSRQFQDALEKKPWSCAAFSSDMEHVAGGMNNKHAIQRWSIRDGVSEGTEEGGKDAVVGMAWHPVDYPMQLYTVGSTGRIYIWTHIQKENWECFAPDFVELEENREYVEREDEFDLNPRLEDAEMAEEAGTQSDVDIGDEADSRCLPEERSSEGGGGEPLLRYLPVTPADIRAALQREQQPEPPQPPQQQGRAEPGAAVVGEAWAGQGALPKGGEGEGSLQLWRQGSSTPSEPDGSQSEEGGRGKRKRTS